VVLPQRGLTNRFVGCDKRKQPMNDKVSVRPALMIPSPSYAFPPVTFAQYAT
jgi:hypothetical protein